MKNKILSFLKQVWQLIILASIMWSIITYPLYVLSGIFSAIGFIAFSAWRVYRFITRIESLGDLSEQSNIQISKKVFGWNALSRLILLKILNDYKKKKIDQDDDSENSVNCWEVLRLSSNASFGDVKKSYKQLAKLYHPDTTVLDAVDAKIKFDELTRCKNVLIQITKDK